MIKLKSLLKESTINTDEAKLYTYEVAFHTNSDKETIYIGIDKEKALSEYEDFTLSDIELDNKKNRTDMKLEFQIKEDVYKYIYDDEDSDISEWEIEEFYDNEDVYELIEEGEFEVVHSKEIYPLNKKSDELLHSIQQHYQYKYGNWKYNRIEVIDDSGDDVGCIRLRIADHTENILNFRNRDVCGGFISVVIGNVDPTSKDYDFGIGMKGNEYHFDFTSENSKDEIISVVDDAIEQLKLYIIENSEIYETLDLNLGGIVKGIGKLKG